MKNRQVRLVSYPDTNISPANFDVAETDMPAIGAGEFLVRNAYFSLDAGFRQWMNAGASDNYLAAMPLGAPVMSITVGDVVESKHKDFPVGMQLLTRSSWQDVVVADGTDIAMPIDNPDNMPLHFFTGALGPTGITAHLGMLEVCDVRENDQLLVSSAAGAVGTIAAQIGRIKGARVIGTTSTEEKCSWLVESVGLDGALNYKSDPDLDKLVRNHFPDGIDVYFDNVGGDLLSAVLGNLREHSRIALCGSVASYDTGHPSPGLQNVWEMVTKRTTMRGFMFSDYLDRSADILSELTSWIKDGRLKSFDHITEGLENTPQAFCDMLAGKNFGKALVKV